jgi:hypothetical protein
MNYQKIYDALIYRAQNRILTGYKEKHHIIPKCLGGSDFYSNIVPLTASEHFVAHQLLVKIYPNNADIIYAAKMMCVAGPGQKRTNKFYSWLKERYTKLHSESLKEKGIRPPSRKGSKWYNNGTENKMLFENDIIPVNFVAGRLKRASFTRPKEKGAVWYNNGSKECKFQVNTIIPSDWIKGRLAFSQEHKDKIAVSGLGRILWNKDVNGTGFA